MSSAGGTEVFERVWKRTPRQAADDVKDAMCLLGCVGTMLRVATTRSAPALIVPAYAEDRSIAAFGCTWEFWNQHDWTALFIAARYQNMRAAARRLQRPDETQVTLWLLDIDVLPALSSHLAAVAGAFSATNVSFVTAAIAEPDGHLALSSHELVPAEYRYATVVERVAHDLASSEGLTLREVGTGGVAELEFGRFQLNLPYKQFELLKALAVARRDGTSTGGWISTDDLIEQLPLDSQPETAKGALRALVKKLRDQLKPAGITIEDSREFDGRRLTINPRRIRIIDDARGK